MKYLLLTILLTACANIPDHHYTFLKKGDDIVKCRKSPVGGGLIGYVISDMVTKDCIDSYVLQGYKITNDKN